MKAGLFIAAAFAQLVAAQPHRAHQHFHDKRVVVTEVDVVTATAPDVVVYVNQFGEPISTKFVNPWLQNNGHKATKASSNSQASTTPAVTTAEPSQSVAPVESPSTTAAAAPPASAAASSAAQPVASSGSGSTGSNSGSNSGSSSGSGSSSSQGYGITYSPYNADGTCKTQAEVSSDFQQLNNFGLVRMYGVDCNQLNTVGSAAIAKGMKLMIGVYELSQLAQDISEIVAFASGNWQHIETVSIGNELINSGQATVAQVVSAVNTARGLLTAAGFSGNVVTVDTWNAVLANPELCQVSDFAAINAHAFFDSDVTAPQAGSWVASTAAQVKAACGGKNTVVTESGWPSQGQSNGAAVPSEANQAAAISSLRTAFASEPENIVLFTAYNDLWKTNFAGSFGAEQYWGIYGTSSQ